MIDEHGVIDVAAQASTGSGPVTDGALANGLADAGTSAGDWNPAANGAGDGGAGTGVTGNGEFWTDGFSDDALRGNEILQRFPSAEEAARELSSMIAERERAGDPEAYDFELPEGMPFDAATVDAFRELAASEGLSPEVAEKLVQFEAGQVGRLMQEQRLTCERELRGEWRGEFSGNVAKVNRTINFVDSQLPGFKSLVNQGIGNHPMFGKFMLWVSNSLAEDSFQPGPGAVSASGEMSTYDFVKQQFEHAGGR